MENKQIIYSFFWKFAERIGVQGIQLIVQILLARLLLPSDFGAIALITIFISVANVFVQTGFNTALIQDNDVTEDDYSSVFIVSFIVAFIIYIILFITAPYISVFYKIPVLKNVIRVLGTTLFFGAFNSIQIAHLSREMQFKKIFLGSIGAYIFSGIISIFLAFYKFGVWAIVAQQLISQIGVTIIYLFIVPWKPKLIFNILRIKKLFSFGSKMLISSLIDTIYNNVYGLVIGKYYSATDLGYYNRADQFPQVLVVNINSAIQSVILPVMSRIQNDSEKSKRMMRRAMLTSSYIVFPVMGGLAICAEPIIILLLTETWKPAIPLMQILCISYSFWPIHTANLQAISALGRSDVFLKLEIIKKVIGVTLLIISLPFGVKTMVFTKIISGVLSLIINSSPNKQLLNYDYKDQIKDLLPNIFITALMVLVVFISSRFLNISIISLIFEVFIGIISYVILSIITKNESFFYLLQYLNIKKKETL